MQNNSNTIPGGLTPLQKAILIRLADATCEPAGRSGIPLTSLFGIAAVDSPMRAGFAVLIDSGLAETFDMPVAQSSVAAARATLAGFWALGRPGQSRQVLAQPASSMLCAMPASQRDLARAVEEYGSYVAASFDAAKAKNPLLTERQHADANPFVYANFARPETAPPGSFVVLATTGKGPRVPSGVAARMLAWVRGIVARLRRA